MGEKDANLRYYNLDEPLKETQWVAGVVSQAFGRKVIPGKHPLRHSLFHALQDSWALVVPGYSPGHHQDNQTQHTSSPVL